MKTTHTPGPDKGMNALNLSTSTKEARSPIDCVTNYGNLGATVVPLTPSNNPGSMTSPSGQGPSRPGTTQRSANAGDNG